MTAIEYCYWYNGGGQGDFFFNWTILILEESGELFMITNIYVIQSHPVLVSSENCTNNIGGQVTCCDVTHISGFDLPMNFAFGVTEAAQGNTHGATLLGFSDTLPQYRVDRILLNKVGLTLSIGSTVPRAQVAQSGLRMLWFVIGKLYKFMCCYVSFSSLKCR